MYTNSICRSALIFTFVHFIWSVFKIDNIFLDVRKNNNNNKYLKFTNINDRWYEWTKWSQFWAIYGTIQFDVYESL